MAGSGSESATELYWHAFAEAEEEEIGSCVGPDAAAPSSAVLCNGAAGSSAAAAASNPAMAVLPQVRLPISSSASGWNAQILDRSRMIRNLMSDVLRRPFLEVRRTPSAMISCCAMRGCPSRRIL